MTLFKYFDDRGGEHSPHGQEIHWPGTPAGFPVRHKGPPPLLNKHEVAERVKHRLEFKYERFCLADPVQKEEFIRVMDRCHNGWYGLTRRRDEWDAETKNMIVCLEWVQIYGEILPPRTPSN